MATLNRRVDRPVAVKPVRSEDPAVEDLQRQVAELQRQVSGMAGGVRLLMVWTGAGGVKVRHGLGRTPIGWIVERFMTTVSPSSVISERAVTINSEWFELYSTGACSATVRVF